MPSTSSQYLQVPKIIPHRKSRSRSRSRSRSQPEAVVPLESPPKEVFVSKPRLHSPQAPPAETRNTNKRPSPPPVLYPPQKRSMEERHQGTEYNHNPPIIHTPSDPEPAPQPPQPSQQPDPIPSPDLNGSIYSDESLAYADAEPETDTPMTDASEIRTRVSSAPLPPSTPSLRERIIGAWKLESYTAYPTPESPIQRPTYPMTKYVTGFVLYTPDGYMSAQMLIPGQQSFKRHEAGEAQYAEAGKRFFGYCGPYYITREKRGGAEQEEEVLRHTFQVCNLPGWVGDLQVRTWRFEEEGKVLVLGSEEPTDVKGDLRIPVLKWRRARDMSEAIAPPPMPRIRISGPGEP